MSTSAAMDGGTRHVAQHTFGHLVRNGAVGWRDGHVTFFRSLWCSGAIDGCFPRRGVYDDADQLYVPAAARADP